MGPDSAVLRCMMSHPEGGHGRRVQTALIVQVGEVLRHPSQEDSIVYSIVCIHMYMYIHVCIYIYRERERERETGIYMCMYVYICIYIYT